MINQIERAPFILLIELIFLAERLKVSEGHLQCKLLIIRLPPYPKDFPKGSGTQQVLLLIFDVVEVPFRSYVTVSHINRILF